MIGNGDGTFQALTATATVPAPLTLGSGDFNGDGKADLVALNGQGDLSLLLNNQEGGFTASTQSIGLSGGGLVVSDFNNDGNSDIAVGDPLTANLVILIGNGKGAFTTLQQNLGWSFIRHCGQKPVDRRDVHRSLHRFGVSLV